MKGSCFVRQFSRLGIALSLLVAGTLVSRAQIGPPTPAFQVTITTPTNNETFPIGADIFISATATDATGFINTMFLYAGSNMLTGRVIDPPFPLPTNSTQTLSYNWTNVPPGDYALTAVAGDNHGLSVTSTVVNISVGLFSQIPPLVTIIATDPIAVEPGTNTNHIIFPPVAVTAAAYPSFTNYCSGTNTATFLVRRIPSLISPAGLPPAPTNDLTVFYSIGGTASNGVDYVALPGYVTIPAGKNYALITINPLEDNDPSNSPPFSTVILTLILPPTANPGAPPYRIHWPDKAGAIILEEYLFPFGPRIGPCGPPIAGTPFPPFHVCFPATNGMPYCLETSSNLTTWTPVCTNLVLKNSIQFVDPDACTSSNCFYRIVRPAALPLY